MSTSATDSNRPTADEIETAVRIKRHPRFRDLCDPSHPDHNPRYYGLVKALAAGATSAPPSLWQRAGTFTAAVLRHVAAGMPSPTPEAKAARLATCHGCDRYDAANGQCRACTCIVQIKAAMTLEHCPLGKWEAAPITSATAASSEESEATHTPGSPRG